ncbi:hypothetical protein VZC37_20730 [Gordonia sp. LSe1-13]|uniref:Uncharacterized protein n=1 Tax=Gordonia sesuvii TaxID=3116777 RepID=A0ABU7MI46_9ACTN|nr:hypothetical protein [Gordonia sp. LSe1-13]
MTIRKKPSAAEMLQRQIKSTRRQPPTPIEGDFAQAIGARLEEREITKVAGLPATEEPEPRWYDLAIEVQRRHQEFVGEREAKQQAEHQAAQSTPDLIRSTLAGTVKPSAASAMPLNGSRVLRAALAGGQGTINTTSR